MLPEKVTCTVLTRRKKATAAEMTEAETIIITSVMTTVRKIIVALSSVLCIACTNRPIYSVYEPIAEKGWHQDSLRTFTFDIDDTDATYDLVLYFRHTERFRYQNLWLFVDAELGQKEMKADTIEFFLADDRGQWLGNNNSGFIEMPVLYEQAYIFDSIGSYRLSLQQGMRDSVLKEMIAVGLQIYKHGKE